MTELRLSNMIAKAAEDGQLDLGILCRVANANGSVRDKDLEQIFQIVSGVSGDEVYHSVALPEEGTPTLVIDGGAYHLTFGNGKCPEGTASFYSAMHTAANRAYWMTLHKVK